MSSGRSQRRSRLRKTAPGGSSPANGATPPAPVSPAPTAAGPMVTAGKIMLDIKRVTTELNALVACEEAAILASHPVVTHVHSSPGMEKEDKEGKILPANNKRLFVYEESLLKFILRLDSIDLKGHQQLREVRRIAIRSVQTHLTALDTWKTESMEAWHNGTLPVDPVSPMTVSSIKPANTQMFSSLCGVVTLCTVAVTVATIIYSTKAYIK
ncbi:hypothetical protein BASA50_000706 [Batrachochytrium salamandrivorans]|uniref:BAG domain-containing protein n=1 Tax=Batrachochytrium salamandrivorans TaxID=1357716 RepID=A0ABQ8ETC7_9FUNG|nr:hypothetical protein BASA60_004814 [Batrachochytrium salamandrivorans]KAH6576788.1 hypothetical protein BASA62_001239 [Batrachochytrium salamandrivorans]KAH6585218.1 hypothetical protein BASA61_007011 [Batrachochytrium salamandrivorans]KAH6586242.1 hypothetical protein BASA50_000706 [Batrachochytrium salamandrivorans]KAH9254951.1 hypothetical protein BASA81_007019 [Batrachochytrium salamandrivorans]